jgi:NAD(P)-dependent dehydrogenase (short-subunit alcohol dehydrogenase family)
MPASPPKTVLVTGASSGIGLATVNLLGELGYEVLAGVRSDRGRDTVLAGGAENVHPVWLDVALPEDCQRVGEFIEHDYPRGLYALVNNAGIAPPAAVELADVEEVRRILEINTLAPLRMIQQCLPALRRARGRIVNMSSMNGTLALPMVGAYSASKFALEALSDALRIELRPWGIGVSVIRPGQVRTEIFAKARFALTERTDEIPCELTAGYDKLYSRAAKFNERGARLGASPERVARAVTKALAARRPSPCYRVGFDVRGLDLLQRVLPTRWLDGLLANFAGAAVDAGEAPFQPASRSSRRSSRSGSSAPISPR